MDHVITILLGPAGVTVLSLLILYGGWKKWWVFGWQYREKAAESAEWKAMALKGVRIAERVVRVAEKDGPHGPAE